MNQEVLLIASSTEGNITAWDVHTGTALTTYKSNACAPNAITLLGSDYFIAAQLIKPALHAWTWHKDQVHIRSFPPEPITALAASRDGAYCAAGGVSGAVHIWDATSGRLLRSWPCHYKKVTSLAFSDSGGELVTGGEDTLVTAWLLAEVLDVSAPPPQLGGSSLSPLHSWSDHTLPVSAVCMGSGGANALVFSVSADRTLKIRNFGTGTVLRSVTFPAPLTALTVDPGEHAVYAASAHGTIYDVSLIGGADTNNNAYNNNNSVINSINSSGGGGDWIAMESHAQAVTCLAITSDAAHLVSGSEDGTARVWDLRSRQPIRTIVAPGKNAISGVLLLSHPEHMPAGAQGGRKGPARIQPLAQLSKYPGQSGGGMKPWAGEGLKLIDGSGSSTITSSSSSLMNEDARNGNDDGDGYRNELEALRAENAKLKEQAKELAGR